YRIETRNVEHQGETFKTSGVVWLGDVEIDSRGLLAGPGDPEERSDIEEAEHVLSELVDAGAGRVDVSEAKRAAAAAGVTSDKTMQRARRRLGLVPESEGYGPSKKWWWIDPSLSGRPVSGQPPCPVSETVTPQGDPAHLTPLVDTLPGVSTKGD